MSGQEVHHSTTDTRVVNTQLIKFHVIVYLTIPFFPTLKSSNLGTCVRSRIGEKIAIRFHKSDIVDSIQLQVLIMNLSTTTLSGPSSFEWTVSS